MLTERDNVFFHRKSGLQASWKIPGYDICLAITAIVASFQHFLHALDNVVETNGEAYYVSAMVYLTLWTLISRSPMLVCIVSLCQITVADNGMTLVEKVAFSMLSTSHAFSSQL